MSTGVDEVHVAADRETGTVMVTFGNVALKLTPDLARELAFALMGQAAKAEGE